MAFRCEHVSKSFELRGDFVQALDDVTFSVGEREFVSIVGPSGKVQIDGQTHHVTLDVHVIEIQDQKLNVKQSFAQRPPRETQAVCDLRKTPNASVQHEIKL